MLNRRTFVVSGTAGLLLSACAGSSAESDVAATGSDFNEYASQMSTLPGVRQHVVQAGQTWSNFFGQDTLAGRHFNRQNVALEPGQTVLVPSGQITMDSISPFPTQWPGRSGYWVSISQQKYAWAVYQDATRLRWGAAVCGHDGRTPLGSFQVTEVAGPTRRSSSYPPIEAAEGRGAMMPYYMRLTSYGIGLHARYIRGRHETKGCIGMFYDDARWLNTTIASRYRLRTYITA